MSLISHHSVKCSCGNQMKITTNGDVLRVVCERCKKIIYDTNKKTASHPTFSGTNTRGSKSTATFAGAKTMPEMSPPTISSGTIDQYKVKKKLGHGGMGSVYLAVENKTQEKIAIKVLEQATVANEKYFLREAQILAKLQHQYLVDIKGQGTVKGKKADIHFPYIVMEYIEGKSLEEILKKRAASEGYALKVILCLLEAIHYAHTKKVIHRDIKPANVMISNTGRIKLIDMGLAKWVSDSDGLTSTGLTSTGQAMGTPYYMPHEQISDAKRASFQSDIYAVGATLYQTLCGAAPFSEYGKNINKILVAKIEDNYIKLGERKSGISKKILGIVTKAMAHNPKERYKNAKQMLSEVQKLYNSYTQDNIVK